MNQEKIGRFIAESRKAKNYTQEELAEKLGITNKAVSKWENGICLPDSSLYQPLCQVLDISINELFAGERCKEEKKALQEQYDNCLQDMKVEIATISAIQIERLKHSPMADAKKQAEEIMEQASKDVLGMLVEESKEHLDEEQEVREEQAEALEEKREEQEAFIEAQKEKKQAGEELIEEIPVEEMLTLEQVKQDVQKEVQNIVDKMKLVAEDIKGAVVDQSV